MNCPGLERLDLYLEGELGRAERRRVEAHLAGCPGCRDRLEERRALLGAFSSLPAVAIPAGFAEAVMHRLPEAVPAAVERRRFRRLAAVLASGGAVFLGVLLAYYLATGRSLVEFMVALGRAVIDVFSLAVPLLARTASLVRITVRVGGELASAFIHGLGILSSFLTPEVLALSLAVCALLSLLLLFGVKRILSLGEKP